MKQAMICLLWLFAASTWAEVVIIANKSVSQTILSIEQVNNIFLGKSKRLADNSPIYPVILSQSDAQIEFLNTYLDMSALHQWNAYWNKRTFTGNGIPPRAFNNPQALVDFVALTEGAIGYVDQTSITEQITILEVR